MVLVVGGPYIWPFIYPLRLDKLTTAQRPLDLTGLRDGIDWIVGQHPGGASRRGWGLRRYGELISKTLGMTVTGVDHARCR